MSPPPANQSPDPQPKWPLWLLGATLLLLLLMAYVYGVEPQGVGLLGSLVP